MVVVPLEVILSSDNSRSSNNSSNGSSSSGTSNRIVKEYEVESLNYMWSDVSKHF